MLSRTTAGNGVPLRRDPVRVIVQPSITNNNGNGNDGITDYTHDSDDDYDATRTTAAGGRGAAALIWLWHQQWTRRAILLILAIIIIIAIAKLSITSSSSPIASRSSSSSPLSSGNDALLGGPPSWRQRQKQQPEQLPLSVASVKSSGNRSPIYRTRPRRTYDNHTTITTIEPTNVNAHHDDIEINNDDGRRVTHPPAPAPAAAADNNDNNNNNKSIIIASRHAFSSLPYGTRCVNSVQGIHHVADSSGAVCTRRSLMTNGCCNRDDTIDLLSCNGCTSELKCCDSFEYCASCCLAAKASPMDMVFENDVFEQCLHLCRTSSRSLKGGNQYRTGYRHCYTDGNANGPLNMTSAKVIAAEIGASCSDACSAVDRTCYEHYLADINTCDMMKKHFPCTKGCENNSGSDQPAYVPVEAPLGTAGQCLINNDVNLFDCSGYHQYTRRLCVCV